MTADSYTVLAQSYDLLTRDIDYERWADYVQWHFSRLPRPVRSVAELGCGTGSLTRPLAQRGYLMTGIDLSPDMLSQAQQKCEGLPVTLVCQDMNRLSLPAPVDAVICCLDSVNYLTRPAALCRTFQRVFRSLRPGGLFLFDVKTPEALEEADGEMYLDETEGVYCVWRGAYSQKRRVWSCGLDIFRLRPDGAWDRGGEYHEERAWSREELSDALDAAGFHSVRRYGELKKRAPQPGACRIFYVAEKDGG